MKDDSWAVIFMMDTIRCRFEDIFFFLVCCVVSCFLVVCCFVIWVLVIAERGVVEN